MSTVIAFTAPFAVYKATVQSRKQQVTHWIGYLADRATGTVVWDDGTSTKYGPDTAEDPAFYSDASLAVDMAEGRLLYEAVERLIAGTAAAEVLSLAISTDPGNVHPAVDEAVKCYGKPHMKRPWLTWLEDCIRASKNTGNMLN
jgi:hypothetical protein